MFNNFHQTQIEMKLSLQGMHKFLLFLPCVSETGVNHFCDIEVSFTEFQNQGVVCSVQFK